MRLILHIFTKDVRRLWWEIAVATGALAYLAYMDSQRQDYMPGAIEGMMNLVVPAAWAYLFALLVHQEPLVGDRQFWLTRPYPRGVLVAAKILFVVVFVHGLSLAADAIIVQARGFSIFDSLPGLLRKQAMTAAALTIPAMALAAMTRNLVQFALAAISAVVVVYLIAVPFSAPWIRIDELRRNIGLITLVLGAAGVTATQYASRRTGWSRLVGLAAFSGALLLVIYLPYSYTATARCFGGPNLTLTVSEHGEPEPGRWMGPGIVIAHLPIVIANVPEAATVWFGPISFEIANASGSWAMSIPPVRRAQPPRQRPAVSASIPPAKRSGWISLWMDAARVNDMTRQPVRLTGRFTARVLKPGNTSEMNLGDLDRFTPAVGRCSNYVVPGESYMPESLLKVVCESPNPIPLPTNIHLIQPRTGSRWSHMLGDAMSPAFYPTETWLSPVHRRQTFFHIVDQDPKSPGSQWLVPDSALPGSRIEITPEYETGCSLIRFEASGIDLGRYIRRDWRQ